jgi:hypothetical protein
MYVNFGPGREVALAPASRGPEVMYSREYMARRVERNLYAYCDNNPINEVDPSGLIGYMAAQPCPCRPDGPPKMDPFDSNEHWCGSGPFKVPDGFKRAYWGDCCYTHDKCYGMCNGPSKPSCDWKLSECMFWKCEDAYAFSKWNRFLCRLAAAAYFVGLTAGGGYAYSKGHQDCCTELPKIA